MPDLEADLFNLAMSEQAQPLMDAVQKHISENVAPITEEFSLDKERKIVGHGTQDSLNCLKGQRIRLKRLVMELLPSGYSEIGEGLTNLDYAYIATELGKWALASESLNCSAPDTGNMEVLERVGTPEQQEKWLKPLLNGEIRSAYAMTEPGLPSSDAKNISTSAVLDGDDWLINGEKFSISGAGTLDVKSRNLW